MPASSASCARRILFSQEFTHRSGTLVTDMPPEQFAEKKPSFSLLSFSIGDCARPIFTSRDVGYESQKVITQGWPFWEVGKQHDNWHSQTTAHFLAVWMPQVVRQDQSSRDQKNHCSKDQKWLRSILPHSHG